MTEPPTVVEEYLEELRRALRVSARRQDRILMEAATHLREVAERLTSSGRDSEQAQREAVARFGTAEEVAALFNAERRRWWMPLGRPEPGRGVEPKLEAESSPGVLAKVRHRWWIVLSVTLVIAAVAALYAKHQPTLYRSTSEVVYHPQRANSTPPANKSSIGGNWGSNRLDVAGTTLFAEQVLAFLKLPHSLDDANRLLARTTISATESGSGLMFTVTDRRGFTAERIANAFAHEFPVYLQKHAPDSPLRKLEANLATLKLEKSDPTKYGPFRKDPQGTVIHDATTGQPRLDQRLAVLLPVNIQLAQDNIAQWLATRPTIVNPASSPIPTQPQLAKTLAIGTLLGLILGTLIALTLPRPPNRGAPAIEFQP